MRQRHFRERVPRNKPVSVNSDGIKTHSFHGIQMTATEFVVALAKKGNGVCPFCNGPLFHAYSNANRHMRFCKERPKQ